MNYKTITRCRVCSGTELPTIFSLGDQALTGVFPKDPADRVTSGPVDLVLCAAADGCGLVQLRQSYELAEMYGENYGYRSGLNASMVRHLHEKIDRILSDHPPPAGSVVVDIGSNDGTSLARYPKGRYELIGVDPSGAKFAEYYRDDVKLVADFFSSDVLRAASGGAKASVVTSFSMFYDIEDPVGFARQVEACLADDGIWVLEQSYLPTMLRRNSFDTICHEHLEFYALRQIRHIADRAGLKVIDVALNDVNGGSFSLTLCKAASALQPNEAAIETLAAEEARLNLGDLGVYHAFAARVEVAGQRLRAFLDVCRKAGKSVYGLGASTKGNVLLQHFNITAKDIAAIGDVNADKFGSFTPGTLIPIVDEAKVLAASPDFLLVLPWHFRDFFVGNPKFAGRKLVFPLPELEVVEVPSRG